VRDYQVMVRRRGAREFTPVAKVTGNYQRLNRVRFESVAVEAVRIEITATNGIDEARVFEVRCYS
jgi:hypothetical protein